MFEKYSNVIHLLAVAAAVHQSLGAPSADQDILQPACVCHTLRDGLCFNFYASFTFFSHFVCQSLGESFHSIPFKNDIYTWIHCQ